MSKSKLFDVRRRADGAYEILCAIRGGEEIWEGLASTWARVHLQPRAHGYTMAEALRLEGWIGPDDPLPVCGDVSYMGGLRSVCLLRQGHEGSHAESHGSSGSAWSYT